MYSLFVVVQQSLSSERVSLVVHQVATTKVEALENVSMIEAEIQIQSPDKVQIWHREKGDTSFEGHETKMDLSLNFNQATLKYVIQINQ